LFKQTTAHTCPHKGRGILLGNGKNSTYDLDEKDHVVLTMTNALPNNGEGAKALYVGLDLKARALKE